MTNASITIIPSLASVTITALSNGTIQFQLGGTVAGNYIFSISLKDSDVKLDLGFSIFPTGIFLLLINRHLILKYF